MTAYVIMKQNYIIGKEFDNISDLPPIKKHFKELIKNKLIIIGKNYFQQIDKEILKGNHVIVLSNNKSLQFPENTEALTIEELDSRINNISWIDILVIGGISVFSQLLDRCDRIYIAYIDPKGEFDTPCIYENPIIHDFHMLSEVERIEQYKDIKYRFLMYSKRHKNHLLFNMLTELAKKLNIEERTKKYAKEAAENYVKENMKEALKLKFEIEKMELSDFDISYHTGVRYGDHICGSVTIYCEQKYMFTYDVLFDAVNGEVIDDFFYS